jgi:hypothetical protein
MRIATANRKRHEEGSILAYFMILMITAVGIASVAAYVTQTTRLSQRRSDMAAANQFAIGGAVIACCDFNSVLTNTSNGSLVSKFGKLDNKYKRNNGLGSSTNDVYECTLSSPFSSQSVLAQIWVPGSSPSSAKIVATAAVRSVTQSATVHVKLGWGYPAAIISSNQGTAETGVAKSAGQDGNVVLNGSSSGPLVVDGGGGLAALANGRVNWDTNYAKAPASAYSMTNWNTANQVPDYTSQGTSNALFDISRFIAVANATPGGYSPSGNNHFTNLATFITAANLHGTNSPMQGVVVVDVWNDSKREPNLGNLTDNNIPQGINVRGTWVMNFCGSGWDPVSEKIIVTADININAADLSHLVATNMATYTTGYPPVYTDPTKNPININIGPTYQNFKAGDDLPAEIYTIGCLDMHGNANICGVLFTPSYMEIENKANAQIQYIRGAVIMGNGIYFENNSKSISIISYDAKTLDSLVTWGGVGMKVKVAYWE